MTSISNKCYCGTNVSQSSFGGVYHKRGLQKLARMEAVPQTSKYYRSPWDEVVSDMQRNKTHGYVQSGSHQEIRDSRILFALSCFKNAGMAENPSYDERTKKKRQLSILCLRIFYEGEINKTKPLSKLSIISSGADAPRRLFQATGNHVVMQRVP